MDRSNSSVKLKGDHFLNSPKKRQRESLSSYDSYSSPKRRKQFNIFESPIRKPMTVNISPRTMSSSKGVLPKLTPPSTKDNYMMSSSIGVLPKLTPRSSKSFRRKSDSFLQNKVLSFTSSPLHNNKLNFDDPSASRLPHRRYHTIRNLHYQSDNNGDINAHKPLIKQSSPIKHITPISHISPINKYKPTSSVKHVLPMKYEKKLENNFSNSISILKTPTKKNPFKYNTPVQYKIQINKPSDRSIFNEKLVRSSQKKLLKYSFLTPPHRSNSPFRGKSKTSEAILKYRKRYIVEDPIQQIYFNVDSKDDNSVLSSLRDLSRRQFEKVKLTMKRSRKMVTTHIPVEGLNESENYLLDKIFKGNPNEVLAIVANIELRRDDLKRLKYFEWLNDECVNAYMGVLSDRSKNNPDLPDCHFFNSFFYSYLSQNGYNYDKVKNWTKSVDIFTKSKVVIPVNHSNTHWTLAIINFDTKCFEYYDSLGNNDYDCLERLRKYVKDQYKTKHGGEYNLSDWKDIMPKEIPHQQNGSDCGVFVCKYADYCSRDRLFDFRQSDMRTIRKRIILEIIASSKKL